MRCRSLQWRPRRLAALLLTGVMALLLLAGCNQAQPGADAGAGIQGRLAYLQGADVYIEQIGEPAVRVTEDGANLGPVWSPDGQWLMWVKRNGQYAQLWYCKSDGTGAQPLDPEARVPPLWTAFSWSPNGKAVAYITLDGDGRPYDLKVARFDQNGAAPPTSIYRSESGVLSVAWSPDGDQLAVSAGSNRVGAKQEATVMIMAANGGEPFEILRWPRMQLPESPIPGGLAMFIQGLTWSPDGKWLTLFAMPQNEAQLERGVGLYLATPLTQTIGNPLEGPGLTGRARPVATMQAHPQWLAWSPDGKQLVAVVGEGMSAMDRKQVALVNPTEALPAPQVLTPGGVVDRDPAWSPDGTRLAVSRARPVQGQDAHALEGAIWVREMATGKETALTRGTDGADWWPRWSADGKSLVWLRMSHDQKASIYWVSADGQGTPRVLVKDVDMPPEFFGALFVDAVMSWYPG